MGKMKRLWQVLQEEFFKECSHVWTDWNDGIRYCILCKLEERRD